MKDPKDYPKDVWNKAQDMTVADADKYLKKYDNQKTIRYCKCGNMRVVPNVMVAWRCLDCDTWHDNPPIQNLKKMESEEK